MQEAQELLKGAYDLHIHAAPSPFNRLKDDFELLRLANEAGMAGILLKSHYESTCARAMLVNTHGGCDAKAYGAIVLNYPVGGLNPYAVANALKRDVAIVYMPTRDSLNSLASGNMPGDFFERKGLTIFDENGNLKPEVFEILDLMKGAKAYLATGHLSVEESVCLCKEGIKQGVKMIYTHPEFPRTKCPIETQTELSKMGVLMEYCWYNIGEDECSKSEMAYHIKTVGANNCYMSTDRGQGNRETPVEGMTKFIDTLLKEGISKEEIRTMIVDVPKRILGL